MIEVVVIAMIFGALGGFLAGSRIAGRSWRRLEVKRKRFEDGTTTIHLVHPPEAARRLVELGRRATS